MKINDRVYDYIQSGRSWYKRNQSAIDTITVHHDAIPHDGRKTAESILETIKGIHSNKGWPGASYHFFIHRDGEVYQLNKLTDITWHDGINNDSVAIVLTGYFHQPHNDKPTDKQIESLYQLIDHLKGKLGNLKVVGHRDRGQTACPGDLLYPIIKSGGQMPEKPNNFDEIIGKSSQRDKVVNEKKYKIGTSDDKDLLEAINKDIGKNYVEKSKVNEKIKDAKKDREQEVLGEINIAFDNPQKEPTVDSIKSGIKGLRGVATKLNGEIETLKEQLKEAQEKPPVLKGKRKLLAGIVTTILTFSAKVLAEQLGMELSVQELAVIALGGLSYIGAEGTADVIRVLKNIGEDSEASD